VECVIVVRSVVTLCMLGKTAESNTSPPIGVVLLGEFDQPHPGDGTTQIAQKVPEQISGATFPIRKSDRGWQTPSGEEEQKKEKIQLLLKRIPTGSRGWPGRAHTESASQMTDE